MIPRMILCLSILGRLLVSGISPEMAGTEIVTNVTANYEFGKNIIFNFQLTQPSEVVQAVLQIEPDTQSRREVPISLNGDASTQLRYDLEANPILPFSRVYYWFEIQYRDGETRKSPSFWFDYVDNTLNWKTSESDLFVIHYVDQDNAFAQQVQNIARDGLKEATKWLPVVPRIPIQIYVYPDMTTLQSALSRSHQPWTAGHADPELGVVLVSLPGTGEESASLERQIPHELMHILQYNVTGSSYSNTPSWLLEGMATAVELYPDPDRQRTLVSANDGNSLTPILELCHPFSDDAEKAYLAYAESYSFVNYLSQRFGSSSLNRLLSAYANGLDCESAVSQVYSLPLNQLESEWKTAEFSGQTKTISYLEYWPVFLISAIILISLLIIAIRALGRKRSISENYSHGK